MLYKKLTLLFGAICLTAISCKKSPDTPVTPPVQAVVPSVTIQDINQEIAASAGVMTFFVVLNKATTVDVSVDYSLVNGTAVAPTDFTSASGTLKIAAGKTNASFDVQIKGDPTSLRRSNIQFTAQLSNPQKCTVADASAIGTIVTENGTYLPTDNTGYTTPATYPGYTLAWSDEFSESTLDLNTWNEEIGNSGNGWGNHELEYYTGDAKNVFLTNGNLVIEARKEPISGFNYSSARLTTQNKKSFKFGRIDIRAKLPVSKGMWPAIWMLGSNINTVNWPACGETDIMELIGTYPSRVTGSLHWAQQNGSSGTINNSYSLNGADFSQQFHVYSLIWQQDSIKILVDDHVYVSAKSTDVTNGTWPFNSESFFIFNVAVGGDWPGPPDDATPFPQRMFVDYVRVFQ